MSHLAMFGGDDRLDEPALPLPPPPPPRRLRLVVVKPITPAHRLPVDSIEFDRQAARRRGPRPFDVEVDG